MALKEYRRKRSFGRTPEPKPARAPAVTASKKTKGAGPEFVVHKHQASHLHYDLRLEHAGVLKSWAVPKGPSMDPRDKRLAVQVEDHPLAYKDFHGRIPEGEYGAGLVEIWDRGTYDVGERGLGRADREKLVEAALRKGHLDLRFRGRKLKGLFTLVHIRPRAGGKDNQWLLMKRADPPPRRPASLEDLDLEGAPPGRFPGPIEPMLATLVDEPFDREGWSFEVKWDGFRSIAVVEKGRVRLVSRNGKSQDRRFPAVAAALEGVPPGLVLDGEIVAVDDQGRPVFQALQNAMRSGAGRVLYYVFDILQIDGRDLRPLPLRRRRAILKKVLPASKVVRLSESVETKGRDFFRAAAANGLEGVMAKDMGSPYRAGGRTREWLKIKTRKRQEAVICGYTRPRASRRYFGALILGAYRNGQLVYIGHVGTGFAERTLRDLHRRLERLAAARSPFPDPPRTNTPVTWVEPRLVCEVEFGEWTAEGLMRQPVFLGLRDDKAAAQVVREEAAPRRAVFAPPRLRTRARLSHLDKAFWPAEGFTKRDLVEYYAAIAPWILPYLKDRPQALNRHPDGISGESFFQKNFVQAPPPWVETVKVRSEGEAKLIRYLVCQNRDTLIYLANLGCIELNVWSSTVRRLGSPDILVFDLDPLETSFPAVIEAVRATKAILDELGLPAFVKTSGATGMHIYVPLLPGYTYGQSREMAHLVALAVNRRHPDLTSLERSPARRRGRIYLDFLQNREGATMAAPYSVRPVPGALVSMPLDWREVTSRLNPAAFTILTVPARLARRGDAWKDMFKKRADLKDALARFERWRKTRSKP